MRRQWWRGAFTFVAVSAAVALLPLVSGAATLSPRAKGGDRLVSVLRPPSLTRRARLVRLMPEGADITAAIGLRPRNASALAAFIDGVTTAGSPLYHHYLTTAEFVSRFGPTDTLIHRLSAALRREGLQPGRVSANHLLLSFGGSVARVEAAFHTRLALFALPGGGTGAAATRPVKLPASIARHVAVVAGLDDLVHPAGLLERGGAGRAAKTVAFARTAGAPDPCSGATTAASRLGGLTDDQIAHSYGAFGLYRADDTGQGESIAVYELEPFARSDLMTFDRCYFGETEAQAMGSRLHVVPVDGGLGAGYGSGEAALDLEDVSAMAPGARLDVFEAPNSTFGSLDDYNAIVSADADEVVTTSWGLCETAIQQGSPGIQQEEDYIFEEAAAQGQTVVAAAGDSGSDDCNTNETDRPVRPVLSVDDPASQPYVLSAGGTTITVASEPPLEQVWDDGAAGGGGGGGISNSWVMPSWQRAARISGVDPSSVVALARRVEGDSFCAKNADGSSYGGAVGEPCREVPDVSADADQFTGAVTQYSGGNGAGANGWTTIGGTSSSAPIWAAMLALVNASPACHGDDLRFARGPASDVGFASPLLYAVASSPSAYRASFTDVTRGSNDLYGLGDGALYRAAKGYDMASGLGSPQLTTPDGGDGLAYYLCTDAATAARPTVSDLEPPVLPTGGVGASLTVAGSGFMTGGLSEVAAVRVGNYLVPLVDVAVKTATQLVVSDLPTARELLPTGALGDGAGAAPVTVTLKDGDSSAPGPDSFLELVDETPTSAVVPAVSSVSPYGGADSGGGSVTVFGSGFAAGDAVYFGGVPSPKVKVKSPFELLAEPPAYRPAATVCATADRAGTDLCQSQVVVADEDGDSATSKILPPYEGTLFYDKNGVVLPPRGCGCEISPAPSEYDYFPPPRITSLSTTGGPTSFASEAGGSTVTITGVGLDFFGMKGVVFGPVSRFTALSYSNISYDTATRVQLLAPAIATTVGVRRLPARIETLGGLSPPKTVTYAGVPTVTSLSPRLAPDTGGVPLTVRGRGLADATSVQFVDSLSYSIDGGVYSFASRSEQAVVLRSPQENPGDVLVEACTASGCSPLRRKLSMTLYPPVAPDVSGIRPASGPARGGTTVIVRGRGLGCVVAVFFGRRRAPSSSNEPGLPGCGSESAVETEAPPGSAGETVSVTVETAESSAAGGHRSPVTRSASFSYQPSAPSSPRLLAVRPGPESLRATWRAPLSDGGSPVLSYTVLATAPGLVPHRLSFGSATRGCRISGLYPGSVWTVTVVARNRLGAGTPAIAHVMPRHTRSAPAEGSTRVT